MSFPDGGVSGAGWRYRALPWYVPCWNDRAMTKKLLISRLAGAWGRRYRHARPEVEAMPWGTLDPDDYSAEELGAAHSAWTSAAFQEHRTAAACASTLRALVEAGAPLDLIAVFARFPLDEIVHVELCARMAMALGGGSALRYADSALCAH